MGFPTALPRKDRTQLRTTGLGYISETGALQYCTASFALVAQALRATALGLRAGDVVTNIIVCVDIAAAGTAGVVNVGLYDAAANKLAASGDVQATLAATGVKACALTAPFTVTADAIYYAVIDMTTAYGTTQPSLGSQTRPVTVAPLAGQPKTFWTQAGQASLPATATPADSSTAVWFAVN